MTKELRTKYQTFDDFIKIPKVFYKTIGFQPFENDKKSKFLSIIFYIGFINVNLAIIGQFIYFCNALGSFSTFLEVTALAACTGECLVCDFKILTVLLNKKILTKLIDELIVIFPKTVQSQKEYELQKHRRQMLKILIPFSVLYMILACTFNFLPLIQSIIEYYFLNGEFIKRLPYFVWYPFDAFAGITYIFVYVRQVYSGYFVATGVFSIDLLLCAIVSQLCMHFDYISMKLNDFIPQNEKEDYEILKQLIKHHVKIFS